MDGKGYHWVAASDDRTAVRACIEDALTAHILRDYDPWAKDLVGGMRLEDILRQLAVDVGRIRVREMTRRPPVTLKAGDEAFRAALARHDPLVVLLMMTQVAMAYPYQMVAAAAAPASSATAGTTSSSASISGAPRARKPLWSATTTRR